jgi:hypothetical protein
MSFLTPLYLAGLLAVGLPVLFHLIRRTPRGRTEFSSLMFLTESPPRITRRSRIEHWLLLAFRAAALILLALAFARPFLREVSGLQMLDTRHRMVAIVMDVSASMRREDLWPRAVARAESVLDALEPGEDVALFTFDESLHTIVDFETDEIVDRRARMQQVRDKLRQLSPGWRSTATGAALAGVADILDSTADRAQSAAALQVELITDLQEGSRLDALQDYQWPARVRVAVHPLAAASGNAGLQDFISGETSQERTWRIRVVSDELAAREVWRLTWLNEAGQPFGEPVELYVPPGQGRVLEMALPDDREATALRLLDDAADFDNTLYLSAAPRSELPVLYVGDEADADRDGLQYYLEQALLSDPRRTIRFAATPADQLSQDLIRDNRLIVVTRPPPQNTWSPLAEAADAGQWIVVVLRDATPAPLLRVLLRDDALQLAEADVARYLLLSEIDFAHPVFQRFSDPRLRDFTKIRFWQARQLQADETAGWNIPARFENRLPALIERRTDRGGIVVLTSSWHRDDSQLASSTKFVALVAGWLQAADPDPDMPPRAWVGQRLPRPADFAAHAAATLRGPAGDERPILAGADEIEGFDRPGVFRLEQADRRQPVAINLTPSESLTTAADDTLLQQYGVQLGQQATVTEQLERQRQMRDLELERRQQIWRWLIAAALLALLAETWLAARGARPVARTA